MSHVDEATPVATGLVATAAHDEPVYIAAGSEHVFGVVTWPAVDFNGTAVLCLHAGEQNLSCHRGGAYTRLCRRLSGHGFLTLRMDFHGSGDSSGVLEQRETGGQVDEDVDAAIRWLLQAGAERVAVVGTCWGALVALTAAGRFEEVRSACLVSPPMKLVASGAPVVTKPVRRDPLRRALRKLTKRKVLLLLVKENGYRAWLVARVRRRLPSPLARVLRAPQPEPATAVTTNREGTKNPGSLLAPMARRGAPVHLLVGERGGTYENLTTPGVLPAVDAAAAILDVVVSAVDVHGLSTVSAQDAMVDHVEKWLVADFVTTRSGSPAPPPAG